MRQERLPLLVTGATGFIGAHLVRSLLAAGVGPDRLRLLVRDPARAVRLGLPEGALCPGSLEDPASLRAAAQGVGAVIHLAGALAVLHREEFARTNVQGTENLVRAVAGASPGARFVHVSSLAAAGPSKDGTGTTSPPDACRPCSEYGRSKLAAEAALLRAAGGLSWIVFRPPLVYGPGDAATRLLFRQALGPVALVPPTPRPLSLIHVRDLVHALRLGLDSDVHGVFVPVEGRDRMDTHAIVLAIAAACARRARVLRVPLVLARGAAALWQQVARWRGRASFFNLDKMREVSAEGWVADACAARRLLGFEPQVACAEGFREVAVAEGWRAPA
ncbi:MAG: NAD-dependent epimerase/dehydratase family protein [Planctomycetes bacterium]|nr:NAD-dependent epimerase/dehydratase family protein [Planctomycetota bacterium]